MIRLRLCVENWTTSSYRKQAHRERHCLWTIRSKYCRSHSVIGKLQNVVECVRYVLCLDPYRLGPGKQRPFELRNELPVPLKMWWPRRERKQKFEFNIVTIWVYKFGDSERYKTDANNSNFRLRLRICLDTKQG